jgi:hypothetical protein
LSKIAQIAGRFAANLPVIFTRERRTGKRGFLSPCSPLGSGILVIRKGGLTMRASRRIAENMMQGDGR